MGWPVAHVQWAVRSFVILISFCVSWDHDKIVSWADCCCGYKCKHLHHLFGYPIIEKVFTLWRCQVLSPIYSLLTPWGLAARSLKPGATFLPPKSHAAFQIHLPIEERDFQQMVDISSPSKIALSHLGAVRKCCSLCEMPSCPPLSATMTFKTVLKCSLQALHSQPEWGALYSPTESVFHFSAYCFRPWVCLYLVLWCPHNQAQGQAK